MIRAIQHVPGFFLDAVTPAPVAEVADAEALLALPWVQRWSQGPGFYRFSESPGETMDFETRLLMAEFDEGRKWWVVAYLRGDRTNLPVWEEPTR